jgi:hypothetical protein
MPVRAEEVRVAVDHIRLEPHDPDRRKGAQIVAQGVRSTKPVVELVELSHREHVTEG